MLTRIRSPQFIWSVAELTCGIEWIPLLPSLKHDTTYCSLSPEPCSSSAACVPTRSKGSYGKGTVSCSLPYAWKTVTFPSSVIPMRQGSCPPNPNSLNGSWTVLHRAGDQDYLSRQISMIYCGKRRFFNLFLYRENLLYRKSSRNIESFLKFIFNILIFTRISYTI